MNITRRTAAIGGLSVLAGSAMSKTARAEFGEGLRDIGEGLDDFVVAQDAYIYGYPLVTMEPAGLLQTRRALRAPTDRWADSSSCANIRMLRSGT